MNYETILVAHRGPSALITLNRPDKLNAMSTMLKAELVRALHDLDDREDVRVIVLTGAGDKAFTAGADIHEFQRRTSIEQWHMYENGALYDAGDRTTKPNLPVIKRHCFRRGPPPAMAW